MSLPPLPEPKTVGINFSGRNPTAHGYTADQMRERDVQIWNLARQQALEEAAQQWDGCFYEDVGESIDIGAAIRSLIK